MIEMWWFNFQQICITSDNLTIHGGAFSFRVPPQNYEIIKHMRNSQRKLKLALYRSLDGIYSDTTFDFIYHSCFEGCPFCIIRQLHQSGNLISESKHFLDISKYFKCLMHIPELSKYITKKWKYFMNNIAKSGVSI